MVAHKSNRYLRSWAMVRWRRDTVTRRLTHRLDQVMDRLHILEGYLIAYLNIDEVIRVIREEDAPKIELTKRFALSETQASAVLDLRLRHLAKLEEVKLQSEQKELESEREYREYFGLAHKNDQIDS